MKTWQLARQELAYLIVAVQFLTRLPVPRLRSFQPAWLDASVAYFPLAGGIVGLICAFVWILAGGFWPGPIAATLGVAAGIAATGAFHEDGLADTADGLGGGQTREQRLEIMKDSRIGTYGAVTLLLTIFLKIASLAALAPVVGAIALLAAHMGARMVPIVASRVLPYVGDRGGAKVAPVLPTRRRLWCAVITGLLPFAVLLPLVPALLTLGFASLCSWWLLRRAARLIGGQTGDVLGAAEQVFEVAVLMAIVGFVQ